MHTRYFVLIICLDLLFALRVRNIKENWKLCNEKFGCFPATVPGHVLLDLNITNPYVDFTELNVSQYSLETWTYSTQFSLVGSNTSVYMLKFEKIDTVARVFLNEFELLSNVGYGLTRNAFRPHYFDIPVDCLRDKVLHVLKVEIESSLLFTRNYAKAMDKYYPHTINYNVWAEPTYRNLIRKPASDFGWVRNYVNL